MNVVLPPSSLIRRYPYIKDNTHIQYNNSDGEQVPSVTTILKIISKDALVHWANSLGWRRKSVKEVLEDTSYVGTMAHHYVEELLKGNSPTYEELRGVRHDLAIDIINCVKSFKSWWEVNSYRVKILDIEKSMVMDDCGGTPDIVCLLDNELTILDFKTSKSFYYTQFLQICKCADLYEHECDYKSKVMNVAILRFNKDGTEADLFTMHDLIIDNNLDYESRELIEIYIKSFNNALELFYNIYDIEQDWSGGIS